LLNRLIFSGFILFDTIKYNKSMFNKGIEQ
jgi:hypothetical protein